MPQIESEEYWNDILEKFSKNKGTITSFCKKNNVNIHRLYNQRRKLKNNKISTFHAIKLDNKSETKELYLNYHNPSNEIRIEIGKAKIFLDKDDKVALSNIFKELTKNC